MVLTEPLFRRRLCIISCNVCIDEVVDQDSRFAKSLGFYEDAPWNLNYHANSERIDSKQLEVRGYYVLVIYLFILLAICS